MVIHRDSILTESVDLLDRLVRFAPNLTQKLFESHATVFLQKRYRFRSFELQPLAKVPRTLSPGLLLVG